MLKLRIAWEGPYKLSRAIDEFNDGGAAPDYDGEDYGLYQIYGCHIFGDRNALLYIGEATDQTFSRRFCQHKSWLVREENVHIYIGRIYDPQRHTAQDKWTTWKADVLLAERILIYKYSPHYNGIAVSELPSLNGFEKVVLIHRGEKHRLKSQDSVQWI